MENRYELRLLRAWLFHLLQQRMGQGLPRKGLHVRKGKPLSLLASACFLDRIRRALKHLHVLQPRPTVHRCVPLQRMLHHLSGRDAAMRVMGDRFGLRYYPVDMLNVGSQKFTKYSYLPAGWYDRPARPPPTASNDSTHRNHGHARATLLSCLRFLIFGVGV